MGIVYHANYLVWMEVGRVEYCRAQGMSYRDFEQEAGLQLAVVEVECRYQSPAHYDEEVIIRTRIAEANPRMIVFGYELLNAATGVGLASGSTKHIFLGKDGHPKKLPEAFRGMFGLGNGAP